MALANLASVIPALRVPGPIAMVDLGGLRTEVTLLQQGEPVWVRTLSRGVEGLPGAARPLASRAQADAARLDSAQEGSIERLYLVGGGSQAEGAAAFLAHELGLPIETLPPLEVDGLSPELAASAPRFAKAISLALGSAGRGHDVDLRRGPLAFQRGFGFLKEKAPILLGLVAATLVSFVFATWAEVRGFGREHDALVERLAAVSKKRAAGTGRRRRVREQSAGEVARARRRRSAAAHGCVRRDRGDFEDRSHHRHPRYRRLRYAARARQAARRGRLGGRGAERRQRDRQTPLLSAPPRSARSLRW